MLLSGPLGPGRPDAGRLVTLFYTNHFGFWEPGLLGPASLISLSPRLPNWSPGALARKTVQGTLVVKVRPIGPGPRPLFRDGGFSAVHVEVRIAITDVRGESFPERTAY